MRQQQAFYNALTPTVHVISQIHTTRTVLLVLIPLFNRVQ